MIHIAIVGAGIIGAATADRLSRAGARVTLIDARQPGDGASGTSLAWLNSNNKDPRGYHDLSVAGIEEWRRLAAGFDHPSWYVPTGSIAWARTDDDRADLAERVTRLRDRDYPAVELTPVELARLEPHLRLPALSDVAYFPAEGFLHGGPAVRSLVERARSAGAAVVTGAGAVTVESDGSTVTGIVPAGGDRITADAYVFCAGAATPGLLAPLGVPVPLVPGDEPGSAAPCLVAHARTETELIGRVIQSPDLSIRPLRSPGLYLEAGDLNATVDVTTDPAVLDDHVAELINRATAVLPGVAASSPVERRVCVRPLPSDGLPIIGWLPRLANAYLIVTHSGMTLGALLGRLAAAELLGTSPDELSPYRPTRF